jgi:hypothetical protein
MSQHCPSHLDSLLLYCTVDVASAVQALLYCGTYCGCRATEENMDPKAWYGAPLHYCTVLYY